MVENVEKRDEFYSALESQRQDIVNSGAEAIIVIAAEHFANFFMNNMPAYCIGISENYEGPIEDPKWLAIEWLRTFQIGLLVEGCQLHSLIRKHQYSS